jgi:diphthamide synthase (EF-2-diphthine--ammonia ligase)
MEYILIAITLISFSFVYLFYKRSIIDKLVRNYNLYTVLLQYNMDKAYETIYKDNILIYSVEATRITDKDFNAYTKHFIVLVEKLLGPKLKDEFIFLYGDYETFVFNVADYFNRKYEEDEVRKSAVDNLMDSEIEIKPDQENIK